MAATTSISSKQVAYRSFWKDSASLGLWESEAQGRKVLVTHPLDTRADVSRDNFLTITPSTALSTTISATAPVVFRINPGSAGVFTEAWLDWTLTETGGTNSVTPVLYPFLFQRIEIGVGASSGPIQTLYPWQLYAALATYSSEDMAKAAFGNALNMSATTFAGPSAIAAGGSARYSMSIPLAMFLNEINFNAITSPVVVSVYLTAAPVVSGTGVIGQSSAVLRLRSRVDPVYDVMRLAMLKKAPLLISYMAPTLQQYPVTLTAGTSTRIPLAGISQYAAGMLVVVQTASTYTTPAAGGIYTALDLAGTDPFGGTIDVLDGKGVSIYGAANVVTPAYLRGQGMCHKQSGIMSTVIPIYQFLFSEAIEKVMATGVCGGGVLFDNNHVLVVTPGTGYSASGTAVMVTVIPWSYATLIQSPDGVLRHAGDGSS